MDTTKIQEFIRELKAGPQPDEINDEDALALGFPDPDEMFEAGADPQFILYSTLQTQLLMMATMLEQSGIVDEYHEIFESALDTYMPGFPPMSPVTDSFFHSWALCDLTFGDGRDNIGRIAAEMMAEMGMPTELRELCGKLLNSRMGIYETIDIDTDVIFVRELVTGRELLVDAPTGYFGEEGELRFVRLGPPAIPDAEYFTELTTPYVLEGRSANDWTRYLKSVMPDSVVSGDGTPSTLVEDRLAAVFKDDRGVMPWMEFVFQGYRGYEEDVIFLTGIPNEPASLPHGDGTAATNSKIGIESELFRQAKAMGISILPPDSDDFDEIEVALTDAQRQAAAELMPHLRNDFRPKTKGKKRILLPKTDWEELSDLAATQLSQVPGRERTRLRNLCSVVDSALSAVSSAQLRKFAPKHQQSNSHTETIYRLRIDLRGITPPIWRRIEVPDCSLAELHVAVQAAMGWTDSHLHVFEINGERYSGPSPFGGDEDLDTIDATDVWLSDVIRGEGAKFDYTYDFGDSWEHVIKVEAIEAAVPSDVYPRCVTGKRNCPPEDCGGIWGYQELLEILSDPEHPEYEERNDWCGEIDPEEFNAAECSREMRSWFSSAKQTRRLVSSEGAADFDIRQDFFDADGEIDADEFQAWCTRLLNKFAGSSEFTSLPKSEYGFVDYLLQFGANYLGVSLATMSVSDLNEIVFSIIPRKVMLEAEFAADVIREFNAFFLFVDREYSLAGAKKLANLLDGEAAKRLANELGNRSNFGMAKSFFSAGKAAGYDMTSQDDLNQFAMAYNSSLGQPTVDAGSGNLLTSDDEECVPTIRRQSPRIGRNDPCPCGSGKKYKKCCQRSDECETESALDKSPITAK
ncbi:MAG: SEC-C metal-binding domain-containing protein [Planctomycetota bacterium]|nr:SEC-C metal-binding domain-containing protein [Planctomycetota bacterium]